MKHIKLFFILTLLGITSVAYSQELSSGVYEWDKLKVKKNNSGEVRSYLKSPTHKLEMFDVSATSLKAGKSVQTYQVEMGTDELIIIKEGVAEIKVNEETKVLGEGSLVVALSGDKVTITNKENAAAVFYSFRFKPYSSDTQKNTSEKISPLFMDWKSIEYKPNATGGRRDFMRQEISALKELEIHVTTLNNGLSSHSGHSHIDEEFVLIRYGNVEMDLDGIHYKGGPGSLFFLASDGTHSINNTGATPCEYYAIRWLTEPASGE